ncbi:hypothetical protein [Actinomyces oris]|uniref:DUF2178 domain-containing protein n=1 Tax=Actinomyces oris TaxID=544580 RepID=A0AAW8LDL5_9ACTO|nr:hypothetical protein [Actinomyces oris]MDR0177692.1 hypothetical protein [Actinomyces oris]
MSESESTPPTPSSAAAAGSSSSDSTSSARAGLKDAKPRPPVVGRMVYVVVVVTLLWVAALTIPMSNGFLYGGASGASAMMLVYVALIVAKRRGYETFVVRELEKRGDERDRAASQRAWALTGVVGLVGNVVVGTVGAFGGSMKLGIVVVLWLQLVSFIGGSIYFNRTM